MRALFLDIDGVLHPLPVELQPGRTIRGKPVARAMSRPPLFCWLPLLVQLLDGHDDVTVVVHSTWRESRTVAEIAGLLSLDNRHVECTCGGDKLSSIQTWLTEHPEVQDFRILDDTPLSDPPPVQLIQCDWRAGLSDPRVQRTLATWLSMNQDCEQDRPGVPPANAGRALWRAAKTASVSYASELDPDMLARVLISGDLPPEFAAHVGHLLDESPLPIVKMAVQEVAAREHVPPHDVWRNVSRLAAMLGISRQFDNSTES